MRAHASSPARCLPLKSCPSPLLTMLAHAHTCRVRPLVQEDAYVVSGTLPPSPHFDHANARERVICGPTPSTGGLLPDRQGDEGLMGAAALSLNVLSLFFFLPPVSPAPPPPLPPFSAGGFLRGRGRRLGHAAPLVAGHAVPHGPRAVGGGQEAVAAPHGRLDGHRCSALRDGRRRAGGRRRKRRGRGKGRQRRRARARAPALRRQRAVPRGATGPPHRQQVRVQDALRQLGRVGAAADPGALMALPRVVLRFGRASAIHPRRPPRRET